LTDQSEPIDFAPELTIAWLGNPHTRATAEEVPAFLQAMHDAVASLTTSAISAVAQAASSEFTPAVTARKSLASPEHIISMIDGRPYKTLRRHLSSNGLTPDDYRQRYGLRADYPMVAPAYSASRSALAKTIGLGRKRSKDAAATTAASKAGTDG